MTLYLTAAAMLQNNVSKNMLPMNNMQYKLYNGIVSIE